MGAVGETCRTFISAEAVAAALDDPRLRLFDCRFDLSRPSAGRELYAAGHLPGAQYADLNRDLSAPVTAASGRHPLPSPAAFAATLRDWGLDRDSRVVAYDDASGADAARLWWMLRWLGHTETCVLDGGYARWMTLGLPVTPELPKRARPGNFEAHVQPEMTVDAAEVLAGTASGKARVLDARGAERFRGDVEPIDSVAGHVPGARSQPFTTTVGADGRTLDRDTLRRVLDPAVAGAGDVVAMCGSGVTACRLLLALEHAGVDGAKLYPGSWREWIRDPRRPIATGTD
jgi:thiosulfate/3-mercaptopyruvate sulfurtransferase